MRLLAVLLLWLGGGFIQDASAQVVVWPIGDSTTLDHHDQKCGDWAGYTDGCVWLSKSAPNARTVWRDANPFQRRELPPGTKPDSLVGKFHLGADFNLGSGADDRGQTVRAVAKGRIAKVEDNPQSNWGNIIYVVHESSLGTHTSMYAHVDWLDSGKPAIGPIAAGAPIARVGNGNNNWAYHLHFEIREGENLDRGAGYSAQKLTKGQQGQIDPISFLVKLDEALKEAGETSGSAGFMQSDAWTEDPRIKQVVEAIEQRGKVTLSDACVSAYGPATAEESFTMLTGMDFRYQYARSSYARERTVLNIKNFVPLRAGKNICFWNDSRCGQLYFCDLQNGDRWIFKQPPGFLPPERSENDVESRRSAAGDSTGWISRVDFADVTYPDPFKQVQVAYQRGGGCQLRIEAIRQRVDGFTWTGTCEDGIASGAGLLKLYEGAYLRDSIQVTEDGEKGFFIEDGVLRTHVYPSNIDFHNSWCGKKSWQDMAEVTIFPKFKHSIELYDHPELLQNILGVAQSEMVKACPKSGRYVTQKMAVNVEINGELVMIGHGGPKLGPARSWSNSTRHLVNNEIKTQNQAQAQADRMEAQRQAEIARQARVAALARQKAEMERVTAQLKVEAERAAMIAWEREMGSKKPWTNTADLLKYDPARTMAILSEGHDIEFKVFEIEFFQGDVVVRGGHNYTYIYEGIVKTAQQRLAENNSTWDDWFEHINDVGKDSGVVYYCHIPAKQASKIKEDGNYIFDATLQSYGDAAYGNPVARFDCQFEKETD